WAEARYTFASWDRVRADWDSALTANLKLAAQVQSDVLFYRRLRRLVALLGDGQAGVIPPAHLRSRIARPPLLLESVEQRPLILEYAENDEMRVARPERLAEIVAVQGVPAESWIHDSVLPEISAATPPDRWQRAAQWMLQGEKGTTLHLLLRLPGGASARLGLLVVRPPPLHRFAQHRAGGLRRTGRGAGLERDGRRGGGPARGIPERSARRDHRGDVSRQSRRGAHDRASQKLGDAAVGDTPCVSQRGRVCGEGHPAGASPSFWEARS